MILIGKEKTSFLLALFRQSDVPQPIAAARSVYQDHVSALAALRMARRCTAEDRREAERAARASRARWRHNREDILVMSWDK